MPAPLFPYIKIYVDNNKTNNDFWITGSQKFQLMKNVTETLAGRVAIIDLLGISHAEEQERNAIPFLPDKTWIEKSLKNKPANQDITDIFWKIFRGSYPKIVADTNMPRDIFYSSYIQTYVERDVKDLMKIGNELKFLTFLKTIAARTGQMINYADIANNIDVDIKTVQSWTSVLETSGIVKMLYPYHNNLTKRAIKTPKIYFLDTGLCSYLCGWDSPTTLMNGSMSGNILETFVFTEILKSYWNNILNPNIYFYRDKDQKEVDFVIETNGILYPIEVKKTANPNGVRLWFDVLKNTGKQIGNGTVICLYNSILPIKENIYSVPVNYI